jgi:hypothetical protein
MNNIDTVSDDDEELFEEDNETCLPEKNTELDTDTSCNDTYFNNLKSMHVYTITKRISPTNY